MRIRFNTDLEERTSVSETFALGDFLVYHSKLVYGFEYPHLTKYVVFQDVIIIAQMSYFNFSTLYSTVQCCTV